MTEEFISKTKLLKIINSNAAEAPNERCAQLLDAILDAQPEAVERIVRCKDCKFPSKEGFCVKGVGGLGYRIIAPDEFCCFGKHK